MEVALDTDLIKRKARELHETGDGYHLTHLAFACSKAMRMIIRAAYEKQREEIKKGLIEAAETNDKKLAGMYKLRQEQLSNDISKAAAHIDVRYEDIPEDEGRLLIVKMNKQAVIVLSDKLRENVKDENGNFNYDCIKKLILKMGHELGHIYLEFRKYVKAIFDDKIPNEFDFETTFAKDDEQKAAEIFSEELRKLLVERYRIFNQDKIHERI
jgi:hypothetical protein